MSAILEDCRGHVHFITSGGGGGSGFYKMNPSIPDAGGGKCLILGIPLQYQEIVQPVVTLDDKRTLYVFGSAWSETMINGVLLLGDNKSGGAIIGSLLSWYEQNKVSARPAPIVLSLGGKTVNVYVTGLRLADANPTINTQNFSIMALTSGE